MTNPQNVTVVVDKLIGFLNAATDNFMRIDLLSRISQLSEKYAPSNDWFVTAMNRTMELAGEQCKPEYANMVMKLIIDNASGQAGEEDIREFAVDTYLHLLATRKTLPDLLVQVSAWVIGEYGHTSRQSDTTGQLHALLAAMDRAGADQAITKGWIISAMLKIVARQGSVPSEVLDIVQRYQNSQQVDLQQRAHEFIELAKAPQLMRDVLPADQASVEMDVDEQLDFLDGYVQQALAAGAKPYQPRSEFGLTERKDDGGLKITAYAAAPTAGHGGHGGHGQPAAAAAANPYSNQDPNAANFFGAGGAGGHNGATATSASGLPVKERKWGPSGFNDPNKAAHDAHAQQPQAGSPYGGGAGAAANFPAQQQGFGGPHEQHGQHGGQPHGQPEYGQPHQPVQGSFGRPQRAAPQVSEKEKLASSLFAGVAPSGGAIGGGTRPQGSFGRPQPGAPGQPRTGGAHQPGASHIQQPQQQQPPKQVDLLGGMFADGAGQAAAQPQQRQADLVGTYGQQPPAGAGGPPSGPPRSSGGPLDLLASSPPPAGGAAPGGFDLLAAAGGDPASSPTNAASAFGLSSASPAIQAQLAPLPKSSPMDVVAGSDARLQVSYIKAYGRESTTIALFLSNKTQQPVPNVTLSLSIPPGLSGNFTGEPTPQARPGATPGTHNVVYVSLAPSQTASLLINLSVRELTFLASPTLSVGGQAVAAGGGAPLSFSVPLELSDMVRPAEGMTTAQYGGFWRQYTDEAKVAIRPSSVTQPPDYMARIAQQVRLFPVQTIGQECIAAGKLVSPATQVGAANLALFVHGKVAAGGVDVIVRSKSVPLSQALVKQLTNVLK